MTLSPHIAVRINLARVRDNARQICAEVGVPLIAVVKADAYGLGAERVVAAISDLVQGFCVFSVAEAATARIWKQTGKTSLAIGPNPGATADDFLAEHVRPAVWDAERAFALRAAHPVLSVDTGMQRFACPVNQIDAVLEAGRCDEAFTHATSLDRVGTLLERVGNRGLTLHAAGSSLLHEPSARLNAVRPGLALCHGAAHVSTPLIETRVTSGPAGYSRFHAKRHGVILAGYSNSLRPGPCLINGRGSRVLEVGMQSAFVEIAEMDQVGDDVVLLGAGITESEIAVEWNASPHEVLVRLCGAGRREYVDS